MRLVVDMNLSPQWVEALRGGGHDAVHWSDVGEPGAPDTEILLWARSNGRVLFTNDLDFTAILAATGGTAPSVLQLRAQDLMPEAVGDVVLRALAQFEADLAAGALLSVDPERARVRKLPIR